MKTRWRVIIFILLCLFVSLKPLQVQAQPDGMETQSEELQTESIVLTDENRYREEYYLQPEVRYPAEQAETYTDDGQTQTLEEYMVAALRNLEKEIDVLAYQIPTGEASDIFFQILNNNAELFYVKGTIGWSWTLDSNVVTKYRITYIGEPEEIRWQILEFEQAAEQAAEQVEPSMSPVEKALVVHDYLVQNCEYDKERLNAGSVPDISHSAYGALVNRIAVCDGYGKAYAYVMKDKLGIPCELISSDSMNHAWNMIELDGSWYHVDATWDDPVRDCIGRVGHSYFLLSDAAVSDSEHRHKDWGVTHVAENTNYDQAFWKEITSAICNYQGEWYYSKYQNREVALVKKSTLFGEDESEVYKQELRWYALEGGNYVGSFMYLSKAANKLYFNTNKKICRLDEQKVVSDVYEPEIPEGEQIFGFTVNGTYVCYSLQSTPNLDVNQNIQRHVLEELGISVITAEDQTVTYDGTAKEIILQGILEGDVVSYAGANGIYQETQPEMINAGVYKVGYRVKRSGCKPFYGIVQLEITKARPQYTLPSLRGSSGTLLGEIDLPAGFVWQTDLNTRLYREGKQTFLVKYVPEDSTNYQTLTDIEVELEVTCPGHRYQGVVTRQPTRTQTGIKTYTCELCGNCYEEELPRLAGEPETPEDPETPEVPETPKNPETPEVPETPKNPETPKEPGTPKEPETVSGPAVTLKSVKKSENGKVKLTWKKADGADGYEIYMQTGKGSYKKIKTITKGKTTSFTKKLKKGKTYSFRIRAYKIVDGEKIYGDYSKAKKIKVK